MSEGEFASPACSMHELEHLAPPKSESWEDIKAWRKARRDALLKARQSMEIGERQQRAAPILSALTSAIEQTGPAVLGIYWPFQGEIDVRDIAHRHIANGGTVALPVVVRKASPVEFWQWRPEVPLSRGMFNIPIPGVQRPVRPDMLIVPLVGFDRAGYRLGYGGGYYDRTLAASNPRPLAIGIGFVEAELETIHPQPHDIPMSRIITDGGSFMPGS